MQSFTVPGRPVAKQRARVTFVRGRPLAYTPGKSPEHEESVRWHAKAARIRRQHGELHLAVRFYGSRGDADNLLKSLLDALNGVAYEDDRQVVEFHVRVYRDARDPRTE